MSHILFSINAILPLLIPVLLGYLFKRIGLVTREVAVGMNRLVFRLFLPVMLFLNVYRIETLAEVDPTYIFYTLGVSLILFAVTVPITRAVTKDPRQRGVLVQGSFRSNFALVGIPLATSLFGEAGGMIATVLGAFLIPLYNVLAVFSLSIFGDGEHKRPSWKKILTDILKNPLILAIALGFVTLLVRALFVRTGVEFRLTDLPFLEKTLSSLSAVATPLSLVVLGAQFEFSAIASLRRQILFAVLLRGVVIPTLGLSVAYALGCFEGAHFAAFAAAFCTPIAVSSVPMAQEMGADSALAGQLVVWTTLVSALTLFASAALLNLAGVF